MPITERDHVPGFLEPARRFGIAQKGQQLADLAQLRARRAVGLAFQRDAHGDALDRAEQVGEAGHAGGHAIGAHRVLEQHRRPAALQQARADLRDLEHGRDRFAHSDEFALGLEGGDELSEVPVGHGRALGGAGAPVTSGLRTLGSLAARFEDLRAGDVQDGLCHRVAGLDVRPR
jgi:hypothetical protein